MIIDRNQGNILYLASRYLNLGVLYKGAPHKGAHFPHGDRDDSNGTTDESPHWSFPENADTPFHCPSRPQKWVYPNGAHSEIHYSLSGLGVCGYGNDRGYTIAYGYPRQPTIPEPVVFSADLWYAVPHTSPYDEFFDKRSNHEQEGGNVQTHDGAVRWIPGADWDAGDWPNYTGRAFPKGHWTPVWAFIKERNGSDILAVIDPEGNTRLFPPPEDEQFGY